MRAGDRRALSAATSSGPSASEAFANSEMREHVAASAFPLISPGQLPTEETHRVGKRPADSQLSLLRESEAASAGEAARDQDGGAARSEQGHSRQGEIDRNALTFTASFLILGLAS